MNKMVGQQQKAQKKKGGTGNFIHWECLVASRCSTESLTRAISRNNFHTKLAVCQLLRGVVVCMFSQCLPVRLPPAIHRHASQIISSPSRELVCLPLRDLVVFCRVLRGHERDSKERPGLAECFLELPRQLLIDFLRIPSPPDHPPPPHPPEDSLLQDQPTH